MIDLIPASVIAIDDQDLAIVNVIADGLDQGLVIVKIDIVKSHKERVGLKVYINILLTYNFIFIFFRVNTNFLPFVSHVFLDLRSETEKIKAERLKIEREKEELLKKSSAAASSSSSSRSKTKADLHMDLPMPVPNLALPMPVNSRGNSAKRERKEISMKLKIDKKVDPVRQWQVEDDDEDDELNETLESVRKVVDTSKVFY